MKLTVRTKLNTAMWVDTFNIVGNVDEQMAEQVQQDIVIPATARDKKQLQRNTLDRNHTQSNGTVVTEPEVYANHRTSTQSNGELGENSRKSNDIIPHDHDYEELVDTLRSDTSGHDYEEPVNNTSRPKSATEEDNESVGQTMDIADDDLCSLFMVINHIIKCDLF